jgi:hypothetical protein
VSNETNGNGRLDRIEEDIAAIASNVRELTALSLRNEFNLAQHRKATDEREIKHETETAEIRALQASTQKHLDYLTQLAGIFADRTVELEDKAKRVKEAL